MSAPEQAEYVFPADVPTRPFFEEVTAVFGGRGSGKTTRAKALIVEKRPPQVIWIDPTLPADTSLDDLKTKIEAGERMIMVGTTTPEMGIAALLVCFGLSTKERPLYVVCDEAAAYLKQPRPSLLRVFNMGRHAGLGIMLLSQRPSGVHPDFRSQAVRTYWGRFTDHNDLAIVEKKAGRDAAASRMTAEPGDFIET